MARMEAESVVAAASERMEAVIGDIIRLGNFLCTEGVIDRGAMNSAINGGKRRG